MSTRNRVAATALTIAALGVATPVGTASATAGWVSEPPGDTVAGLTAAANVQSSHPRPMPRPPRPHRHAPQSHRPAPRSR
jgi:hypothetical protein